MPMEVLGPHQISPLSNVIMNFVFQFFAQKHMLEAGNIQVKSKNYEPILEMYSKTGLIDDGEKLV